MFIAFLFLIFVRPFISSLAFPEVNAEYSIILLVFFLLWTLIKGLNIKNILCIKYPLLSFCFILLVSMIFSGNHEISSQEIYKYFSGLMIFIITASFDKKELPRALTTITLGGLVISMLAIYQYFLGYANLREYIAQKNIQNAFAAGYIEMRRVFFPFVTPNTLGSYLAMIMPLCLIQKRKTFFTLFIVLALFLTKSLGAIFSLFLGLSFYFFLKSPGRKRGLLLPAALLLSLALIYYLRSTQQFYSQPAFSAMNRLAYWSDTLKIIAAHPLKGIGIGNFNIPQARFAHNSFLQFAAETGIPGLLIFFWFLSAVFKKAALGLKNTGHGIQIKAMFAASSIFLVNNIVDFGFFLPEVSLIWWAILGYLFSCSSAGDLDSAAVKQP